MKELRGTEGFVYAVEAELPGEISMIRTGVIEGRPMSTSPEDLILVPATFSLTCQECSADEGRLGKLPPLTNMEEARLAGWWELCFDPLGMSWNYIGVCPDCAPEYCSVAISAIEPAPRIRRGKKRRI